MVYKLRQARPNDKEWVYRLNRRCYRDLVVRQFGQWDEQWQRDHFEQKWASLKYEIAVSEGQRVGALSVRFDEDCVFLAEIQIAPEFQKRGLGTSILRDLVAKARARELPLRLRVLRQNRAKTLYSRLGFTETGETGTHILMEKPPDKRLHMGAGEPWR